LSYHLLVKKGQFYFEAGRENISDVFFISLRTAKTVSNTSAQHALGQGLKHVGAFCAARDTLWEFSNS